MTTELIRPIHIQACLIRYKNVIAYLPPFIYDTQRLPLDLQPSRNATFLIPIEELQEAFRANGIGGKVKVKGAFRDGAGKHYYSKAIDFNVNETYGT